MGCPYSSSNLKCAKLKSYYKAETIIEGIYLPSTPRPKPFEYKALSLKVDNTNWSTHAWKREKPTKDKKRVEKIASYQIIIAILLVAIKLLIDSVL